MHTRATQDESDEQCIGRILRIRRGIDNIEKSLFSPMPVSSLRASPNMKGEEHVQRTRRPHHCRPWCWCACCCAFCSKRGAQKTGARTLRILIYVVVLICASAGTLYCKFLHKCASAGTLFKPFAIFLRACQDSLLLDQPPEID